MNSDVVGPLASFNFAVRGFNLESFPYPSSSLAQAAH